MERLTLIPLDGAREGETVALDALPATIGSEPGLEVVIPGAAPRHASLERGRDGELVLRDAGSGSGTFLAGQPVREAVLHDGDVVELGHGGPRVRFRRQLSPRDTLVGVLRGQPRSDHARRLRRARYTLRRLTAHPLGRITLTTLVAAVPLLLLLTWSRYEANRLQQELDRMRRTAVAERDGFYDAINRERTRNEEERVALEKRLDDFRQREARLTQQLTHATNETLQRELQTTRERILTLESERAAGENIIRQYGAGVCLIQGSYAFYDSSNRPLRHKLDESGRKIREDDGTPSLAPDGTGAIYTVDYYGTGFLVDRRGLVLSNRHVAVPWWDDDKAEELKKDGFKARFVLFRAFFPKQVEPFELEPLRHSETMDLAVLKIDLRSASIPVLPLEPTRQGAVPGHPVVVVGYPTGLEAILAKAETDVVQGILKRYGRQSEHVTEALSEKGLIRPSTTQGHIGDVTPTDIVFDAPTTQGGSGGPVFNREGQVIAIEYAVLPKFGGTAFGIPIHYAIDLVKPLRKGTGGPAARSIG
jgi:pSer/pThr/pTyr-binding forkhead associated (FHA) protein